MRQGVKFHDGSDFNADAVVFNMDRLFDEKAPQYSARMVSLAGFRAPSYKSVRKIDDYTVEFTTKAPDASWPYQLSYILDRLPQAVGDHRPRLGQVRASAVRHRPVEARCPQGSRSRPSWCPTPTTGARRSFRSSKGSRCCRCPMPARARPRLLAGQVDWIEAPAPDAIPRIKAAGLAITANIYPHVWAWQFNRTEGSPWNDIRVRKAVNLAIDRKAMVDLLGGYALEATGHVPKGDAWYGSPGFDIATNVEQARKLLAEAGYGPEKPLKIKMLISSSGSGQMASLQMNEALQQSLKAINIDVAFEVVEWQALLDVRRAGSKSPQAKGAQGINIAHTTQDPFSAFARLLRSDLAAPAGVNFGYYSDPEMDKLLVEAQSAFDPKVRDEVLAKVHTKMVDDALFLWVVHDLGPRAMSPKVKGFVQARNWFQNLSSVTMDK